MKFKRIKDVKSPTRGTELSAGIDFYVPNSFDKTVVKPGSAINIPSGIRVKLPYKHALIAFNKSGVALKKKLIAGACVIDEDYQGEIHLHLINVGNYDQVIKPGDKILQFLLTPVNYAMPSEVPAGERMYESETQRGEGGFGSTGNR